MKLLIATRNPGKLDEVKRFLSDLPIELVGLADIGVIEKVEETGKSFEENAILKARFYARLSRLPTLADDGGFEIDALDGQPGVQSHRWVNKERESTDEELIRYTLKEMKGVPLRDRGAKLRLVIALAIGKKLFTSTAEIRGVIPLKPSTSRTVGFPYRSLLYLPQLSKFYNTDDLTPEENDAFNHRKRAIEKLKPLIRKYLISKYRKR
jgi:XTP/dITP diphosphohydrolase